MRLMFYGVSIMAKRVEFRTKKSNHMGTVTVLVLVAMLCSGVFIKSVSLGNKRDEYNKKIEALNAQITEEEERTKELEEYEKYTKTVKYVEEVAKEKLGLVYEDEIVFESGVEEE